MYVLTERQLSQVKFGIDNNIPLQVRVNKNGNVQTRFLDNQDNLREISSKAFRSQRIEKIAESLTKTLYHSHHTSLDSAEKSLEVKTAKKFCQITAKQLQNAPCVAKLKRQLLSSRLNIPIETFDSNPGFYEFASTNYLYHYIRHYGHQLKVDVKTYDLEVLCDDEWRSWADVKDALKAPLKTSNNHPKQPWVYGPKGVQNKDMYCWKELSPYKFDSPDKWGKRWVFEVCACNVSSPQKTGDHSWFRLKTPKGEVYSIGLYRQEKSGPLDNFNAPFRIKKGHLMQPDLSEYYPCNIHSIEYEINEDIFNKMKQQIENDKHKDEELFQAIEINCTQYVNKIAGLAGIHLPTKKRLWRFITPKALENILDTIAPYIPSFIKKICDIAAAVFLNTIMICLGATKNDPIVINGCHMTIKPHISSFWDIFDPNKASLNHPHTLGWDVHREVTKWRAKELKRLKSSLLSLMQASNTNRESSKKQIHNIKKRIKEIPYDLPSYYKNANP